MVRPAAPLINRSGAAPFCRSICPPAGSSHTEHVVMAGAGSPLGSIRSIPRHGMGQRLDASLIWLQLHRPNGSSRHRVAEIAAPAGKPGVDRNDYEAEPSGYRVHWRSEAQRAQPGPASQDGSFVGTLRPSMVAPERNAIAQTKTAPQKRGCFLFRFVKRDMFFAGPATTYSPRS